MHSSIQVFASTFYQAVRWASGTELEQPVSALRALGQVTRIAEQTQKLHYNLERAITEERTTCCGSVISAWECGGTPSCLPSIYPSLSYTNRILIFVGDDNGVSWKCTHPSLHCRERWPQDSSDQWDVSKHCWERLLGNPLKKRKVDLSGICPLSLSFSLPACKDLMLERCISFQLLL